MFASTNRGIGEGAVVMPEVMPGSCFFFDDP